jgi:hypothetical protein
MCFKMNELSLMIDVATASGRQARSSDVHGVHMPAKSQSIENKLGIPYLQRKTHIALIWRSSPKAGPAIVVRI